MESEFWVSALGKSAPSICTECYWKHYDKAYYTLQGIYVKKNQLPDFYQAGDVRKNIPNEHADPYMQFELIAPIDKSLKLWLDTIYHCNDIK